MTTVPVRLAHLVSHPIQYYAPLYRELASRPEIDLTVFFYSDATLRGFHDAEFGRELEWDVPLLDGYRSRILSSARGRPLARGFFERPHWDVLRELAGGDIDAVWTLGYSHPTTWLAAAVAAARRTPLLIRDDQTLLHGRPPAKRVLKAVALRALLSRAYCLYVGAQNRRYFRHYGVPAERLFHVPHAVDNAFFSERAEALRRRRRELREAFGLPVEVPAIVFAGKLVPKKEPLVLLDAFAKVRAERACTLLIAGDGPLRRDVERRVADLGLEDVRITGFLNQTELPRAYAAGDVFVLPSSLHETWGLVVNEAMNFALPIVASDKVGCAADLVRDGWNGFVVPARDSGALADALARLVDDAELRTTFGTRSRELVAGFGVETAANGVVAAVLAATRAASARAPRRARAVA